jgi:transposase
MRGLEFARRRLMSATQTITEAGAATFDAIASRPSPKLTAQPPQPPQKGTRRSMGETPCPLSSADSERLTRWTRAATSPRRLVTRSLVVLLAASGASNVAIATRLGVTRATVALWKARFLEGGPGALLIDAPGRGRKRGRDPHLIARILHARTQHPPRGTRWTMRDIARRVGASHATVQRVLREHEPARDRDGEHTREHAPQRASEQARHRASGIATPSAKPISETPHALPSRAFVATALPMSHASTSTHVIAIHARRADGDVRSRRTIHRKVTA